MNKGVKGIISLIFAIGLLYFFFGGGIENQVALDSEKQYEIAKNNGNAIDAYVHAGMVAAAYLQAEDEVNYKKWKEIEKEEANNAGMPTE